MTDKTAIFTENAPAAIGPYSQAVRKGNNVYLSGQIPIDPKTGTMAAIGFEEAAVQVFENLSAVAEAAGGTTADFVKLNIYVTDLTHFPVVNEVMKRYFQEPYPARATVQVAALPMGAALEIDGVMDLS